jgi:hypothetical protein
MKKNTNMLFNPQNLASENCTFINSETCKDYKGVSNHFLTSSFSETVTCHLVIISNSTECKAHNSKRCIVKGSSYTKVSGCTNLKVSGCENVQVLNCHNLLLIGEKDKNFCDIDGFDKDG